jgi:hypothetical protein
MNPDFENKHNTEAKADHKYRKVLKYLGLAERKETVDLVIAGATTLAVLFWIATIIAGVRQRESWLIWLVYFSMVFSALVFFLNWQKHVWERETPPPVVKTPDVGIDGYRFLVFEPNKPIQIQALLANRGDDVAYRLRIASALSHGYPPIPKPFKIPVKDGDPMSSGEVGVGGNYLVTLTSNGPVSKKQIAEILSGKRGLYVMGKGTYYDRAGECYPLKYCAFFDHVSGSLGGCPEDTEYEHEVKELRCPPN